jgi:hypothetical protein
MKTFDLEQGGVHWLSARSGIPTSSEFRNIVTPKTGRFSKSAEGYANKLVAEIYMKEPIQNDYISFDMERGKIMEAEASRAYEQVTGMKTTIAGFITDDKGMYGCSPDRFVGDKGLVEIKCLKAENHMAMLLSQQMDDYYKPQVQGQLLICEDREWVDMWFYHPKLPSILLRNYRDEEYQAKLKEGLEKFWDILIEKLKKLEEMGYMNNEPDEQQNILDAG